jgi:energy-coupling factor transport system permease protein
MESILIGRYVPGESLIHRMDPRAKLLMVFFYVFIVFLANNYMTYTLVTALTVLVAVLTHIPIRYMIKGLKPILWMILFTFILHVLFTKEGHVILDFGVVKFYSEGVKQGIFISIRFLLLIMITTVLTLTTTPIEVTDGMESLLSPFKKFGLPVHELALMMSISLRFIPTLMQETEKIMKAQTARGADFTSGPMKDRLKAIVPLLVPLFINAFKRAEELATAMEARGYRGGEGRTKFRQLQWKTMDTAALTCLFLLGVCLIFLRT